MTNNISTSTNEIHEEFIDSIVTNEFGQLTLEQASRRPRLIPHYFSTNCPEELQQWMRQAYEEYSKKPFDLECVKNAHIIVGCGDRAYKITAGTLNMADGQMEQYRSELLQSLEELGCNYGIYLGELD